jgi:hypothetical protein
MILREEMSKLELARSRCRLAYGDKHATAIEGAIAKGDLSE